MSSLWPSVQLQSSKWVAGKVVSARDALENNGRLHEDVDDDEVLLAA